MKTAMTPDKCEYSRITIPTDKGYIDALLAYVQAVALKIGFTEPDRSAIGEGVRGAVSTIFDFSFEPREKDYLDISCERIPAGLRITLHDKGLPWDAGALDGSPSGDRPMDESGPGGRLVHLKAYLDEVLFNNLGRDGKQVVLIKYLRNKSITDYYDACELTPYAQPAMEKRGIPRNIAFTVRPMQPDDALEVSKCIYKTYGYTYSRDDVYYPEKLIDLNRSGALHSAVAVAPSGEIAGHCALQYEQGKHRIAELTQGAVKPEFRSMGCFSRLTEYLIERATADALMGVYARPVTNHVYSQQVGHRFGLLDCGIILGLIPITITFKQMPGASGRRICMLTQFRYIDAPGPVRVFAPPRHRRKIVELYDHLGMRAVSADSGGSGLPEGEPIFSVTVVGAIDYARIDIRRYGKTAVRKIRTTLKELCLKKIAVIHLFLDLSDPVTGSLSEKFEDLGFFFSGILPGAAHGGDALVLQYLNNVPVAYDEIQVVSPAARGLLAYVRAGDPNRV